MRPKAFVILLSTTLLTGCYYVENKKTVYLTAPVANVSVNNRDSARRADSIRIVIMKKTADSLEAVKSITKADTITKAPVRKAGIAN